MDKCIAPMGPRMLAHLLGGEMLRKACHHLLISGNVGMCGTAFPAAHTRSTKVAIGATANVQVGSSVAIKLEVRDLPFPVGIATDNHINWILVSSVPVMPHNCVP